jgi:hypothetical protein
MNWAVLSVVAARGSALPVSDRKIGSANGNRTCQDSVQLGSVGSKCLSLRSVGSPAIIENPLQSADVAARCQRTARKASPGGAPNSRLRAS